MKKYSVFSIIFLVLGFCIGFLVANQVNPYKDLCEVYELHHKATEDLLDTLETEYNWVDKIDHDAYYETNSELNYFLYGE